MFEIVKNPRVDWLGIKRPFIFLSIVLLLIGAISVYYRGFNLGIDFAGGTLVTVKFKRAHPPEDDIRRALAKQGIDPGEVILQPVRDPLTGEVNQMLIRLPQRRERPAAPLETRSAENAPSPASATEETGSLAEQLDAEKRAIEAALRTFNESAQAAGKIDLNTIGRDRLRDELMKWDPLGLIHESDSTAAASQYERYAELIATYRDQQRGGLIDEVKELAEVPGLPRELVEALPDHFFAGNVKIVSADIVGPQIGEELRQRAIYVVLASFAGMLLYIAFRFEWVYGVAAIVAVFHDLLITFGAFSLLQKEISLAVVAAFLTLAGYSVNDTIVVFDRIRENLRLRRRDDLRVIVNDSINQTLSRTIMTSGTTLVAVAALVIFGPPVLDGFAWALLIGITVGTYSSIAIASPVMVWWQRRKQARMRARRRGASARRSREAKRKVAVS